MRRDFDLIRQILLRVEAVDTLDGKPDLKIEHFTDPDVAHNLDLIVQAGLISGAEVKIAIDGSFITSQVGRWALTWPGHDFLDSIRDDSLWAKIKEKAKELGLGLNLPIRVITDLGVGLLRTNLGLGS